MSDPVFRPLEPTRLQPEKSKPVPVNWFEQIAPRMPEPPKPPPVVLAQEGGGKVRNALFRSVDEIAAQARREQEIGEPEPEEIILLRHQAQQEAQQLIGQALEQAEIVREEARQQGHAEGYAQGHAAGQQAAWQQVTQEREQERALLRADITDFVAAIEAERQRAWGEMEPQIMTLVFALCKKVIKQEVEVSRSIAIAIIQNALRRVADSGSLRIRVHPEDLEAVRSQRAEFVGLIDGIRHIEIIDDRRVGRGGAIVETDGGNIDARIETQLAMVGDTIQQMGGMAPTTNPLPEGKGPIPFSESRDGGLSGEGIG